MKMITVFIMACFLAGCSSLPNLGGFNIKFLNLPCIVPFMKGNYLTCNTINITINNKNIVIPQNFKTDGISSPNVLSSVFPHIDPETLETAILHDYLYESCEYSRKEADRIFYTALLQKNVSHIKAKLMYLGVRHFGDKYYGKNGCRNKFENDYKNAEKT